MASVIKQHGRKRGIVSVELALLTPILLMLVFAVIEFSWFFVNSGYVTNIARHAGRMAVRPDVTNAEITADVVTLLTKNGLGDTDYTLTISANDVALVAIGDSVTVNLSIPYADVTLNLPFVPTPSTLGATVTMAKESP